MPVLGKPTSKCEHGIFKAGEATARYCSFCNPQSATNFHSKPRPVSVSFAKPEVVDEVVLDCFEFQGQDLDARLKELGRAPNQYDF